MPFLAVLKNFINSEKAVASFVVLAGATAFVFTGKITVQEWMDFSKWVLGIYVGGKAIQGAASQFSGRPVKAEIERLDQRLSDNDKLVDELVDKVFPDDEDEEEDTDEPEAP